MRTDILDRKQEIVDWIEDNQPKSFICKQLNCKPETLESYLRKFGITYRGNMGMKGKKDGKGYVPASEYIKGSFVSAHKLRLKLLKEGIKEHKCEICGIVEWMGSPAPLELDHIDGNHFNNEMENLRILCPNCHSQTDTNSGKKNKRILPS
jgi:Zn finger protein HypA/HybF involved in hydrogenase expression